jgi:hypothetical protein
MSAAGFTFRVHPERLAIARLPQDAPPPAWARGGFVTVSRTPDELSVVCAQQHVPAGVQHERDRVALGIAGVVPMTTVGVLAQLCGALAAAGVSVFVLSTHDTDWILVRAEQLEAAAGALRTAGHVVQGPTPG